mgnify:CR=1 FL=1
MDIADNRINLTAQDIDFSVSANETISCSYEGQNITIGFKSTFLVEILSTTAKQLRNDAFKLALYNGHPGLRAHEYRSTIIENWMRGL